VKSIIEETGVEAIDTREDGIVRSDIEFNFHWFMTWNQLQLLQPLASAGKNYCKGFVKYRKVQIHYQSANNGSKCRWYLQACPFLELLFFVSIFYSFFFTLYSFFFTLYLDQLNKKMEIVIFYHCYYYGRYFKNASKICFTKAHVSKGV
jgi:hypothetical protein